MTPSSGGTSFLRTFPVSTPRSETLLFTQDSRLDPLRFSLGVLRLLDPSISSFVLSESQRLSLEGRCGTDFLPSLRTLSQERDPRIFFQSLELLAQSLEEQNLLEPALAMDSLLRQTLSNPRSVDEIWEPETRRALRAIGREAGARAAAMLGRGTMLPRIEFLGRRLLASSLDLPSILAMGTAGIAGRGMSSGLLGLTRSSASRGLSFALGSSLLASGLGLGAEAFSFTAVHRMTGALLGRNLDWSREALWGDFFGAAITLSGINAAMRVGNWGVSRFLSGSRFASSAVLLRARQILPEISIGLGIFLGHRLEEGLGLRETGGSWDLNLVEALATWCQLKIGSRVVAPILAGALRSLPSFELDWNSLRLPGRSMARQVFLAPFWMMLGASGGNGDLFGRVVPKQLGLFSEVRETPNTPLQEFILNLEREGAESQDLALLDRLRARGHTEITTLRELTIENQSREQWQERLDRLVGLGLIRESGMYYSPELTRRSFILEPVGEKISRLFDRVESRLRVSFFNMRVLDLLSRHRTLGESRLQDELRSLGFCSQQVESLPETMESLAQRGLVERVRVPRRTWGSERPKGIFRLSDFGGMIVRNWRARAATLRAIRETLPR